MRIGSTGDGLDHIGEQAAGGLRHRCYGAVGRIHRSIACSGLFHKAAADLQLHRGGRNSMSPTFSLQAFEYIPLRNFGNLFRDDDLQILFVHLFLLVRQPLKAVKRMVEFLFGQPIAQLLQPLSERMPAGQLTHHQLALDEADGFRLHDLVGALLLQQSILMNPGGVRKGIGSDDSLVRLDDHTRDLADQPTGLGNLLGPDAGVGVEEVFASPQPHDDFFQRGIAGPFTDPVDRAFHLPGPFRHRRQRISHRHPQIIMAVDRDHSLGAVPDPFANAADQETEFLGRGVSHRVRNVDGASPCPNDRLQHFVQKGWV